MEKTIEIPEGYEARIEGNKVVFEQKESEDERMINKLQGFLSSFGSDYFGTGEWQKFDDWLERQKEQKPAEWSEEERMHLANAILAAEKEWGVESRTAKFLKFLRPSWKPSEEQPEVDLEKEIDRFLSNITPIKKGVYEISRLGFKAVARHFYELGRAKKEE